MATATAEIVFPHISKDPTVCSGRPCVDGTRVRVVIHAALAYYNDHKDEIEADLAADVPFASVIRYVKADAE